MPESVFNRGLDPWTDPCGGVQTVPRASLQAILEMLNQAVSVFDDRLRLFAFNKRYADMLSYPPDFLRVGLPYEELARLNGQRRGHSGEALQRYIDRRSTQARQCVASPQRLERVLPDGRIVEIHRSPWPDGGVISTYSDITDRKQAEEAAKRAADLLGTTLENMADGIRVFDKDLKLVVCNQRALEMFDHPARLGKVGTSYAELLAYNEQHGQYAADSKVESSESRMERAKDLVNRRTPYFSRDGRVIEKRRNRMPDGGFVATYRDITELYNTQQMLIEAKEKAESASRAKSQFLATMSHELRTPLNPIIGFSELMEQQLYGPLGSTQYDGYVHSIKESALHLLSIINDVLDIAKVEAGKAEPGDDVVCITDVVDSCVRLMQENAHRGSLKLNVNLPADLPKFRADPRMVKQIVLNLLSNAIKFTPGGGSVTLAAEASEDGLKIIIADTGIGIAESDIERALAPFEQVDRSLNRKYDGTGLGLPLARSFAQLHGGDLTIRSQLGAGTTITVTFPARRLIVAGS